MVRLQDKNGSLRRFRRSIRQIEGHLAKAIELAIFQRSRIGVPREKPSVVKNKRCRRDIIFTIMREVDDNSNRKNLFSRWPGFESRKKGMKSTNEGGSADALVLPRITDLFNTKNARDEFSH